MTLDASDSSDKEILGRFFPAAALDYCVGLWHSHQFLFKIKNKRTSKLGDYRYDPKSGRHTITINNDLNRYSFLITYVHEVAHLVIYENHKRTVAPHGKEWKSAFKRLMFPLLSEKIFPEPLFTRVVEYIHNPKAASCNDHNLTLALANYDGKKSTLLQEIELGSLFRIGRKTFKKEALRRTRYVCLEVKSGRKYLISKAAQIDPLR